MTRWTNKSVVLFAGQSDPIARIQRKARELVFQAMENGWSGPPYNPVQLADLMDISVEPTFDIADARTIRRDGKPVIEFNPSRTRERVRFSIAHEVAHSLFDDVHDEPRHRGGTGSRGDEWQLEMLCNLAASEFVMPIGSLATEEEPSPIEQMMEDRRRYDVSVEAYLIRIAKISPRPIGVFCASHRESMYEVNYFIPSAFVRRPSIEGTKIPKSSAAYRCTAIGYTDRGNEDWILGVPLQVEYVGIPSYSGSSSPRIMGLVRFEDTEGDRMPIRYVHGDVLDPRGSSPRIVCQLVNDIAKRWGGVDLPRSGGRLMAFAGAVMGESR